MPTASLLNQLALCALSMSYLFASLSVATTTDAPAVLNVSPLDYAIWRIGATDADIIAATTGKSYQLEAEIRHLATQGSDALPKAPRLMLFLKSENWDVRAAAANALGEIGYKESIPELIALLANTGDLSTVNAAAESLGRLRATDALQALETVATQHWFPPIRDTARKAKNVILGADTNGLTSNSERKRQRFRYGISFLYSDDTIRYMPTLPLGFARLPPEVLTPAQLKDLGLTLHVAKCGLSHVSGYVLGFNRGEWGGELLYINKRDNSRHLLIEDNISAIYPMPFGNVVVAGLDHMALNYGMLYLIDFPPDALPRVRKWNSLPSTPKLTGILPNGNLILVTRYETIVVTPQGDIRMANESDFPEPAARTNSSF